MMLNALASISAGLCGITLTLIAIRAPSLIDDMDRKGRLSPEQAIKYRKFLRPASILGALCGFAGAIMGFFQK